MNHEKYTPPTFGTMKWLSCQAGYQKVQKLIDKDGDIKLALKDMLLYGNVERLPLEIYRDFLTYFQNDEYGYALWLNRTMPEVMTKKDVENAENYFRLSGEVNALNTVLG